MYSWKPKIHSQKIQGNVCLELFSILSLGKAQYKYTQDSGGRECKMKNRCIFW